MPGKQPIFCDFDNGYLYRFDKSKCTYNRAGWKTQKGYIRITLNGKEPYAHRYLYEKYHGIALRDDEQINHINLIKDDNRITNLEIVTNQQNCQYQQIRINNTSGYKGVYLNKPSGKWQAQIRVNGRLQHIGLFDTKEEASEAYISRARELNAEGHMYYIP